MIKSCIYTYFSFLINNINPLDADKDSSSDWLSSDEGDDVTTSNPLRGRWETLRVKSK